LPVGAESCRAKPRPTSLPSAHVAVWRSCHRPKVAEAGALGIAKPPIGRSGENPTGAGLAQPRCSLYRIVSLSMHKHEVCSIIAADTALDVAAHTLARCRVRLGPPRWALPQMPSVSTLGFYLHFGRGFGQNSPGEWRDRGTAWRLSWGEQPHAKTKHPALWMVPARPRFF